MQSISYIDMNIQKNVLEIHRISLYEYFIQNIFYNNIINLFEIYLLLPPSVVFEMNRYISFEF